MMHYSQDELLAGINTNLGEIAATMGLEFVRVGADFVEATLPVEGNRQPYGFLHGGASALLAETLGSVLCGLLAPDGKFPVGIELSCSHHRSATAGLVLGRATMINAGRTLATVDIRIADQDDRAVTTARLTCLFRSPPTGVADFPPS